MDTTIHYDLDGCHGILVWNAPSWRPSTLGWIVLLVCVGGPVGLGVYLGSALPPLLVVFVVFATLFNARQDTVRKRRRRGKQTPDRTAAALEQQAQLIGLLFARRPVAVPFRVKGRTLTVKRGAAEQAYPLEGARVRTSDRGVVLSFAFGEPLELMWSDADPTDVTRLADALRGAVAADPARGTADDVPEALREKLARE